MIKDWIDTLCYSIFKTRDDRIALVESSGKTITYKELYYAAINMANILLERKITRNVILYTGNSIEYVVGLLAIWLSNHTAICCDSIYTKNQLVDISKFCESNCILYSKQVHINNVDVEHELIIEKNTAEDVLKITKHDNELAFILPTSGTTNNPKFVMLAHKGLSDYCNAIIESNKVWEKTREVIIWPITSCSGTIAQLCVVLCAGGSCAIYQGNLNIPKVISFIDETKSNFLCCTASMMTLFMNFKKKDKNNLACVEKIILGGEPTSSDLIKNIKETYGIKKVVQLYGLTEASSIISGSSEDYNAPENSVGRPLKVLELRIVDNGKIVDCNNLGEIEVKGKGVMVGYYKNEKLTKSMFHDGWLKTGDIGYLDEKGYLYIRGRIKNLVIINGKNVYVEEVEEQLNKYDKILRSYVYGEESSVTGEILVAKVVVKKGESLDLDDLRTFCIENMSSYMIPKKIEIVNELDIGRSGKIQRK